MCMFLSHDSHSVSPYPHRHRGIPASARTGRESDSMGPLLILPQASRDRSSAPMALKRWRNTLGVHVMGKPQELWENHSNMAFFMGKPL